MRILCIVPSLGPGGAGRQVEMLAAGLHQQDQQVEVCELGPPSRDFAARIVHAGIVVHSLGWTRPFDPTPLWHLHRIVRDHRPDVVHVWGRRALRAFALVGRKLLDRVVLSQPFAWDQRQPTSALDRWLFRKVARIFVQGEAEASLAKVHGLFLEKIAVVPPGVAEISQLATENPPWAHHHAPRTTIMCLGPLERHKGFRSAIWAFDLVRFAFRDLHLVLVGTGPDETYLRQMAVRLRRAACTHFLPAQADAAACLGQADICWVPSLRGGGTQAVLEAMLAARPIVVSQVPGLDGIIVDGQSGFIVPPDDKLNMVRRTRQILLDPDLGRQLGAEARRRALQHFSAEAFVQRCRHLYLETAA